MTAAYFEDHPTDPEKVILRKKPRVEDDDDTQVYKKPWVGLTFQEQQEALLNTHSFHEALIKAEKKLKEKNT